MSNVPISVITCTHNPRPDYIGRTLAGLNAQTLPTGQWELVVVDNCSDPPLRDRLALGWHQAARTVREETLGLTPARLRGIREARGELLIFVDDDNVLDPDFLEQAVRTANERPWLGAWSGQCRPEFEVDPPDWTRRYWGNLVIREFDHDVWSNLPRLPATMPCGAGLCVRRDAALEYMRLHDTGRRPIQMDRTGTSLVSGGDNDLAACACDIGLGQGLIASLKLTHLIAKGRLTEAYLERLSEGIYLSGVVLAHMRANFDELESYKVRLRDRLRVLTLPEPHRRIARAALRGRARGLELISRLSCSAGSQHEHP
ncbi:glycosyltransferase [Microbaculum marinum]|uniref:Glycosyltransferase n=1 Tax=Microbaculum marinum TaxID=1764581 RepID=A0AAW9RR58_9HYPH